MNLFNPEFDLLSASKGLSEEKNMAVVGKNRIKGRYWCSRFWATEDPIFSVIRKAHEKMKNKGEQEIQPLKIEPKPLVLILRMMQLYRTRGEREFGY